MDEMTKDDKINIKLEVCKDKTSGKLSIMAHFDSNAPNVFKERDVYFWMPTTEEKELINEVFEFIPIDGGPMFYEKTSQKPVETKEEKPTPEPTVKEEIKPTPETQPQEDKTKYADLPPLEKPSESDVFEATDDQIKNDDLERDIDKEIEYMPNKAEEQIPEEPKSDDQETEKKEENEGIIIEADPEAIEAGLKMHNEKDESTVEADEQTIIDKVLSQKKKGKWSMR
jgi:type IV secretory pathway VirB10-like protein